jgi:hypothetical protein
MAKADNGQEDKYICLWGSPSRLDLKGWSPLQSDSKPLNQQIAIASIWKANIQEVLSNIFFYG